jgi:putative transposase
MKIYTYFMKLVACFRFHIFRKLLIAWLAGGRPELAERVNTVSTLTDRLLIRHWLLIRWHSPCGYEALRSRLKELGEQYPRYGYLMLHLMLKAEGLVVNRKRVSRKRTYRLYKALVMQVPSKRRKKLVLPRTTIAVPTRVHERWSLDFVHDQLANGQRIGFLNIVDDYSRDCVGQLINTSISGLRLTRYVDELSRTRSLPKSIVMENGPELTSKAMLFWSQRTTVKLNFIQPGKPTQNAFVESFNARLRESCLNKHWFKDLAEARRIISDWKHHYNHERPHSSLEHRAPAVFDNQAA